MSLGGVVDSINDTAGTARVTTATTPGRRGARWMSTGLVVGPVLFTGAWLLLGFVSPGFTMFGTRIAPYSPMSAGISGLGLGVTGPYMNAVFVLTGLLMLLGVIGALYSIPPLRGAERWRCIGLLALTPVGAIIDGFFTVESFLPHFVGAVLGFGSPVVSFVVTGRVLRRVAAWQAFGTWLIAGSPLTLVLMVLYFATFTPTAAGARSGVAGLTERILVVEVLAWFAALGWLAFRGRGARLEAS